MAYLYTLTRIGIGLLTLISPHFYDEHDKYCLYFNNNYSKSVIKHIIFENIHKELISYAWNYDRAPLWCFDEDFKKSMNF